MSNRFENVRVEKTTGLGRKLSFDVPQTVVAETFNLYFQDVQKQVALKGFRKGKAPINVIRQMYTDSVKEDVAKHLARTGFYKAVEEQKLELIGSPEFHFEDPSEGKDFTVSAQFEVRPEVKLKKFEGLSVKKEKLEVDNKFMDQTIQQLRSYKDTFEDVLEDRAAVEGDQVILDFEGSTSEGLFEGGSSKDFKLKLGSKMMIPGFEDGVLGMKVGQEKTITVKFPTDYGAGNLAGKDAQFKINLNKIQKLIPGELGEEIFKIYEVTDESELRAKINETQEKQERKRIQDQFQDRLLKTLVRENPVDVPVSLLEDQKKLLIDDFVERMKKEGLLADQIEDYLKKWDSEFQKTASEMIQGSFLVDALAEKFSLGCGPEDLDKKYQEYSEQVKMPLEKVRAHHEEDQKRLQRLAYLITEQKVISFLESKSKVQEVPGSEFKDEK